MLYAITFLGAFAVVEAVEATDQVARDAADTLKANTFAHRFSIYLSSLVPFHEFILLFIILACFLLLADVLKWLFVFPVICIGERCPVLPMMLDAAAVLRCEIKSL